MSFPEFPGSAFFLAFLYHLIGSPEFPGMSGISPERALNLGSPNRVAGEDGVGMLGSGDAWHFPRLLYLHMYV